MSTFKRVRNTVFGAIVMLGVMLGVASQAAGLPLSKIGSLPQSWRGVARGWTGGEVTSSGEFVLSEEASEGVVWEKKHVKYWVDEEISNKDLTWVKDAVTQTAKVTGVAFEYAGRTTYDAGDRGLDDAPNGVVISVEESGAVDGFDGASAVGFSLVQNGERIKGAVVLFREFMEHGDRLQRLVMHEMGHVMGLAHSEDETQVMYSRISDSYPAEWGRGDRDGFSLLYPAG